MYTNISIYIYITVMILIMMTTMVVTGTTFPSPRLQLTCSQLELPHDGEVPSTALDIPWCNATW